MKNEIMFGILFVAIAAVGAAALTTVLFEIIPNADAKQCGNPPTCNRGPFPPGQHPPNR